MNWILFTNCYKLYLKLILSKYNTDYKNKKPHHYSVTKNMIMLNVKFLN